MPAIRTSGPSGRYGAVLFCEKEGFNELFRAVRLAERYDLAIMSTKGVSVTAARRLVDEICHRYQIPLFCLHDFDRSGFTILRTLQCDTRRYAFENEIDEIGGVSEIDWNFNDRKLRPSQAKDIARARGFWRDYLEAKRHGKAT